MMAHCFPEDCAGKEIVSEEKKKPVEVNVGQNSFELSS